MIRVVVGLIIKHGRILLCQRKRTGRFALKWEFPGGKVEEDEEVKDSLRRELHEELGIHAEVGELFHRSSYDYPGDGSFDIWYYLVPSYAGETVNRSFETMEWVPVKDLVGYDILEGNREVVDLLVSARVQAVSAKA